MQNEAVASTIPFTVVHGNTELCCVNKHCLEITNVKNQMRMNAKDRNFGAGSCVCTTLSRKYFWRKTCASVKQSELLLQAAAEKLTSDFETSCANPKNLREHSNKNREVGVGENNICLRLCEQNDSSPYQNETLELQSYMFPVGCRTRL